MAAATADVLDFLTGLPTGKRQPTLLFAAVRFLDGLPAGPEDLRRVVVEDGHRLRTTNLPVRWIAQEGPGALPDVEAAAPGEARGRFLLSMDGRPVAWTAPHGGRIDWLGEAVPR
jgi:hypothetical protein